MRGEEYEHGAHPRTGTALAVVPEVAVAAAFKEPRLRFCVCGTLLLVETSPTWSLRF